MAGKLTNAKRSALYFRQAQTPPTPPSSFIETTQPIIVVPQFATVENDRLSGHMNSKTEVVDLCKSSASFLASVAMRETGTTTLNIPTEYAELLKVSGFQEAASPAADTYELVNNTGNIGRGSARVYMDDKEFVFTDTLVGSSEIVLEVGNVGLVNTTLTGYIDNPVPNDVTNPSPALSPEKALIVSCADVVTLGGVTVAAERIVFKTNPVITNTYTMGGASGIKADTITDYMLTAEITFPVESAVFGREASLIKDGDIKAIRVVIGAKDDGTGTPVDGQSTVIMADTTRATTYADTVNGDLLQRTLTLRLFDNLPTPAMRIITGEVAGL